MKFEDSTFYKELKPFTLNMPFGKFYLLEKFIIGELNDGIHLDWEKAEKLVKLVLEFYGDSPKIAFISNRVNAYSIDPQNWMKFEQKYDFIIATAAIIYNNPSYLNISVENRFYQKGIKCCLSLEEAIKWVKTIDGLN